MIFLRFYMEFTSLLFLKTKEKGNELLHLGPWVSVSSHGRPLAEGTEQGGSTAPFPARFGPGGEGKVGEKGEGARAHLPVVSVGVEVACGGLSAGAGGRRRPCTAAAALRRGGGGLARLESSVGAR